MLHIFLEKGLTLAEHYGTIMSVVQINPNHEIVLGVIPSLTLFKPPFFHIVPENHIGVHSGVRLP